MVKINEGQARIREQTAGRVIRSAYDVTINCTQTGECGTSREKRVVERIAHPERRRFGYFNITKHSNTCTPEERLDGERRADRIPQK